MLLGRDIALNVSFYFCLTYVRVCNVLASKKAIKYDHSVLGIEILMILQEAGQLKSQRINNSAFGGSLFILISASMYIPVHV